MEYRYDSTFDENVFCPIRSKKRDIVPCNMKCAWYDWDAGRCLLAKGAVIPDWIQHKKEQPAPTSNIEEYPED